MYFLPIILTAIGLDASLITVLSGVITTWFWLGTIPLVFTIEKFGRRKILLTGSTIETLTMLTFIVLIAIPNPTDGTRWASFALICIFVFTFGYSTAGMIWLYSVEVSQLLYPGRAILLTSSDPTARISAYWRLSVVLRRMASHILDRLRWTDWDCECWLEAVDLDPCWRHLLRCLHLLLVP